MISRRALLLRGLLPTAVLAAAGAWYEWRADPIPGAAGFQFRLLTSADRAMLAAIAPVITGRTDAGGLVPAGVEVAMQGLPEPVRAQLRQLFGLLRSPLGRLAVAGVVQPWSEASPESVARFLQTWRVSPLEPLRSAYDALHQLMLAAYYGGGHSWPEIGYAGPPRVR